MYIYKNQRVYCITTVQLYMTGLNTAVLTSVQAYASPTYRDVILECYYYCTTVATQSIYGP